MQFDIHKEIKAPAADVFALITNDEKMKLWMPQLVSNTYPHGIKPALVGTHFIQKVKEGARVMLYTGEITAYEPDSHFAISLGNYAFNADIHYRLRSKGEITQLDYTCNVSYKGWFYRAIGKWFFKFMVRLTTEQLQNLERVAANGN